MHFKSCYITSELWIGLQGERWQALDTRQPWNEACIECLACFADSLWLLYSHAGGLHVIVVSLTGQSGKGYSTARGISQNSQTLVSRAKLGQCPTQQLHVSALAEGSNFWLSVRSLIFSKCGPHFTPSAKLAARDEWPSFLDRHGCGILKSVICEGVEVMYQSAPVFTNRAIQ